MQDVDSLDFPAGKRESALFIGVRADASGVALFLALDSDGDLDVFLDPSELRDLIAALTKAQAIVERERSVPG